MKPLNNSSGNRNLAIAILAAALSLATATGRAESRSDSANAWASEAKIFDGFEPRMKDSFGAGVSVRAQTYVDAVKKQKPNLRAGLRQGPAETAPKPKAPMDPAERPSKGFHLLAAESYRLANSWEIPNIKYLYLAYQQSWRVPKFKRLFAVVEPRVGAFVDPKQAIVGVLDLLLEYRFLHKGPLIAFCEGGGGLILTTMRDRLDGPVNFDLVAGVGGHWMLNDTTALTTGFRFDHISNGGIYSPNVGINSHMPRVGLTYFY